MKYLLKITGILLPILAVALLICQVIVSNELATLGKKLGRIDYEIGIESDIHEALAAEAASASALMTVRERATAMGFIEPSTKQILHLPQSIPVAFDPNAPVGLRNDR